MFKIKNIFEWLLLYYNFGRIRILPEHPDPEILKRIRAFQIPNPTQIAGSEPFKIPDPDPTKTPGSGSTTLIFMIEFSEFDG